MLKLFFGRYQSKENKVLLLEDYKQKLNARYQTYEDIEQVISNIKITMKMLRYWLFTLDYGKRVTKAAIDWCTYTLEQISKRGRNRKLAKQIYTGRYTTENDKDIVVFIIGMRVNKRFKHSKWLPVFNAMPGMIKELYTNKEELGFLSTESILASEQLS